MQTLAKFFGVIILSFAIFSGCNENISESSPVSSDQASLSKGGKVVESITGSGNFRVEDGIMRVFTLNARRFADGSVDGHFNLNRTQGGTHYSGSVICFSVEGNKASFVGIIENSNNPNIAAGDFNYFAVADNGQGKNASPDQISFSYSPLSQPDVDFLCGVYYDPSNEGLPWNDVEAGNINIKK